MTCGTTAGYAQHRYRGEPTCAACRKAEAVRQRQQRRGLRPKRQTPRHGTVSGWQRLHLDEPPCDACREAKNEDNRARRRGRSQSSRHDRVRQADTTVDVMLTRGYPLRSDVIAELVCEIHPEWSERAIRKVLHRLQDDGLVELVDRLEPLWQVTDAGEEWFYGRLAS